MTAAKKSSKKSARRATATGTGTGTGTRARPSARRRRAGTHYWSGEVTAHSDALDLDEGVFKRRSARSIARSLKRSAEQSHRRKASPFQSAMSMLNFYINRAGKGLDEPQRSRLQAAKSELRALYGRSER